MISSYSLGSVRGYCLWEVLSIGGIAYGDIDYAKQP